jgi:D-alanyl-D-alanine carboxypeptidase/D-alanyl-D-alanine-endopeptidase (penicillin-binding protein 4)
VVDDPATYAASELARLLRERGVEVGTVTHQTAPRNAKPVASVVSAPLRSIVSWMLRSSDNLTAELLTKELGVHAAKPGSTRSGIHVIEHTMKHLGVALKGSTIVDGSGLDRANRETCHTLQAVVKLADRPDLAPFRDALPAAGRGTPLDGLLHAKSGYLDGVTGLVGTVQQSRPFSFAFLANGNVSTAASLELNRFVDALATWSPPPLLDTALVPPPRPARHHASVAGRSLPHPPAGAG